MNNSDMPAMPLPMVTDTEGNVLDAGDYCPHNTGLSKREHFAAMAPPMPEWYDSSESDEVRFWAWPGHYADCALAALEQKK